MKKNLTRLVVLFGFALMSLSFASAASFDCRHIGKLSETETAICTNAKLSKLDETLNSAFQEKLKASPYKLRLRQQQRVWIAERNTEYEGCGGGPDCVEILFSKYQERIKSLSNPTETQSCPTGDRNSAGLFSGDWIFEGYVDGKRWEHALSIVQTGANLTGGWWMGIYGGQTTTGKIRGTANELSASIAECTDSEQDCSLPGRLKAKIEGEKLTFFECSVSGKCAKKNSYVLYHSSSKPCAGF